MKIVPDWKKAHKWLSIQLCSLGIVSTYLWDYVPALQSSRATMILFILIAIGRLVKQGKDDAKSS